ncbi:hypothetical protein ACEZCY_34810 [Streptacidiphilus sp. N1-12]|uniref:Uncharacterized protein n=2 Tax=Streptacidiphilus alkalitolerans TaxID=3342712 RepID=A0ABV6VL80_9ACTN
MSTAIATTLATGGLVAVAAPSQAAVHPQICSDAGIHYDIINKSSVLVPTNLYSAWVPINGSILPTYNQTKTATVSASGTATVSAEAGIIFAKASTSFAVTVGKSWSKSGSWTYAVHSIPKKSGKKWARLMMFHSAKKFTAEKYSLNGTCSKTTIIWKKVITAPVAKNDNYWSLQYK